MVGVRVSAIRNSGLPGRERLAAALSLFCPPLKYHFFELNAELKGYLPDVLRQDVKCNLL